MLGGKRLFSALRETRGQDLAEYAVLAVLIAVAVIAALTLVAPQIAAMFNAVPGAF